MIGEPIDLAAERRKREEPKKPVLVVICGGAGLGLGPSLDDLMRIDRMLQNHMSDGDKEPA